MKDAMLMATATVMATVMATATVMVTVMVTVMDISTTMAMESMAHTFMVKSIVRKRDKIITMQMMTKRRGNSLVVLWTIFK